MPISFDFERSSTLVVIKIESFESAKELTDSYSAIFTHPKFNQTLHSVWDISAVSIGNVPLTEVRNIARLIRGQISVRGEGFKVALVTTRAADRQLLKLYIAILKLIGNNLRFKIYGDLDAAIHWAG